MPETESQAVERKIEEIMAVLQPAKDKLVALGYQPRVIADGSDGVIRMTLEVHKIGG